MSKKRKIDTAPNPLNNVAVIGTGPVGLLAALSLAKIRETVHLIGQPPNDKDARTSALMLPAIAQLEQVGIWNELRLSAASLQNLRMIDATSRLLRAPTVTFRAAEIGEAAFGYNIPNKILNKALYEQVKATSNIIWHETQACHYDLKRHTVTITLEDNTLCHADFVIAADGSSSPARQAAGVSSHHWHYPQTALVLNFSHQYSHQNTSNELHTNDGPFTQVPLPAQQSRRSSLVWVMSPQKATQLLGIGRIRLAAEIETYMSSMLGKISLDEKTQDWPPQAWPMRGTILTRFATKNIFLVGEAAHVFPPIGAQGLNLGFRDIADLLYCLQNTKKPANIALAMDNYNRRRRLDIWGRTCFVHMLNRSLLSGLLPAQIVRHVGLEALRQIPPLRTGFMHEGLQPGNSLSHLLAKFSPKSFFRGS